MAKFMRTLLIGTALLVGALLLACGSDDGGDSGGPTDAPDATSPSDESPTEPPDANGDQPAGDAATELRDVAGGFGEREIKIEYEFTSGLADGTGDGTMTLYWKPPDAQRTDISTSDGEVTLITTASATYFCSPEDGGQCFESPIGDSLMPSFFGIFTDPDTLTGQIDASFRGVDVDRSSRTIAGQDATCFSISGMIDDQTGAAEYCFRDYGVLLLMRAGDSLSGGEFSLEAISVEDSVSDSDLEPPYEVFDLGDIPDLFP